MKQTRSLSEVSRLSVYVYTRFYPNFTFLLLKLRHYEVNHILAGPGIVYHVVNLQLMPPTNQKNYSFYHMTLSLGVK